MEKYGVLSVLLSILDAYCSGANISLNCGNATCSYDSTVWTYRSKDCDENKMNVSFQRNQIPFWTFTAICSNQSQLWEESTPLFCSSHLSTSSPSTTSTTTTSPQPKTTQTTTTKSPQPTTTQTTTTKSPQPTTTQTTTTKSPQQTTTQTTTTKNPQPTTTQTTITTSPQPTTTQTTSTTSPQPTTTQTTTTNSPQPTTTQKTSTTSPRPTTTQTTSTESPQPTTTQKTSTKIPRPTTTQTTSTESPQPTTTQTTTTKTPQPITTQKTSTTSPQPTTTQTTTTKSPQPTTTQTSTTSPQPTTTQTTTTKSPQPTTTQTTTSTRKTSTTSPPPEISKVTTSPALCNLDKLMSKFKSNLNVVLEGTSKKQNFQVGDKLNFKCAKDTRFMNGSLEQECGSGGSWEKEIPYCQRCKCPCTRMKNQVIIRTQKELQDKISAIQKKLVLEKKNLASQKNTKISVADPRPSAKAVGSIVGVGIIMFTFAIIVLSDLPVLYRHIRFGPRKKIKRSAKSHSKSQGKKKKNT